MPPNLIVLSFDALQSSDLDVLLKLPNFSRLASKISMVRSNREIYPSLTYPIHSTIITGVYPETHGIFHNQKPSFDPSAPQWSELGRDWYFEKHCLKVPTLVDACLAKGYEVATVMWPSTAGDQRGYNLSQIWAGHNAKTDPKTLYALASSPNIIERYFDDYLSRFNVNDPWEALTYSVEIALDVFRTHKPNLLLAYVFNLDHVRHVYGTKTYESLECLRHLDIIMGRFIQTAKDIGVLDRTNFVVLGDHGQIDIENLLYLNAIFQEYGLIVSDGAGNMKNYEAYSFSTGFSTQINPFNKNDLDCRQKVYNILLDIQKRYPKFIERIYTEPEARQEEGLSGDFWFVLEGTTGTHFMDELDTEPIVPKTSPKFTGYRASHGHHPSKGEKPPFLAWGPSVVPGLVIEHGEMIDVCPTLAALMEVPMPQMLGTPWPIIKASRPGADTVHVSRLAGSAHTPDSGDALADYQS